MWATILQNNFYQRFSNLEIMRYVQDILCYVRDGFIQISISHAQFSFEAYNISQILLNFQKEHTLKSYLGLIFVSQMLMGHLRMNFTTWLKLFVPYVTFHFHQPLRFNNKQVKYITYVFTFAYPCYCFVISKFYKKIQTN